MSQFGNSLKSLYILINGSFMSKVCYNCGVPLKKKVNKSKEHVPAENLFDGFDSSYKVNRITVPACITCNGEYSLIDHNLRDLLAIKNNDVNSKADITRKGAKSIVVHSDWRTRVTIDSAGNAVAVSFSERDLWLYHIKNFKALYYHKYKSAIGDGYQIDVIPDYDKDNERMFNSFFTHLSGDACWHVSGHEGIFKYILQEVNAQQLAGLFVYHNEFRVLVIAANKTWLAAINPHYKD
jgi:hypothetical protein